MAQEQKKNLIPVSLKTLVTLFKHADFPVMVSAKWFTEECDKQRGLLETKREILDILGIEKNELEVSIQSMPSQEEIAADILQAGSVPRETKRGDDEDQAATSQEPKAFFRALD